MSNALIPAAATSPILADSGMDPNIWSVTKVGGLSLMSAAFRMTVAIAGLLPIGEDVVESTSVA